MTIAPGQMRFINSSLVTSSPADCGQDFDDLEGTPTNRNGGSENPKFAAGKVDLALA